MNIKTKYIFTAYILILITGAASVLSGCATTKAELISHKDKHQTWRVDEPISNVFKTFRDYAQVKFSNTLKFGTGIQIHGEFFGDTADLSITQLDGFPVLKRSFSLYIELKESEGATVVNAWAVDKGWLERLSRFRTLFPSTSS